MKEKYSSSNSGFQIKNLLRSEKSAQPQPKSTAARSGHRFRRLPRPAVFSGRFFSFFRQAIIGQQPKIKLTDVKEQQRRRKLALSIGSILLLLFVISIGFGWRQRLRLVRQEKVTRVSQRADWVLAQAQQLSAVSPSRAHQLLREEQQALTSEIEAEVDQIVASQLEEIKRQLKQAEREVSRSVAIKPELYLKLEFIRSGSSGTTMSSAGRNLLVLDAENQVLLAISMTDRNGEVVGGGETFTNSRAVSGTVSAGYVLTADQVVEVILANKTSTPVIKDSEKEWKDPAKISSFAGNIYLLDREAGILSKYPAIEAGFGRRRPWFAPGINPDLSAVVDLEIDGDVWLLENNGQVSRYRLGAPLKFNLTGLIDEFERPVSLSVPREGSRIWLLDQGPQRVVAFDRQSGDYAGRWEIEGVETLTDLVVNEELGKIFLLAGEKIYSFEVNGKQ